MAYCVAFLLRESQYEIREMKGKMTWTGESRIDIGQLCVEIVRSEFRVVASASIAPTSFLTVFLFRIQSFVHSQCPIVAHIQKGNGSCCHIGSH